ncbi:Protein cwh43 [Sorochytrium milnesiophthora]
MSAALRHTFAQDKTNAADVRLFPLAHSVVVSSAFAIALAVSCHLHYYKIVKNAYHRYPDEWFPSISAVIGDWFPERNIFHLLMALAATPRFLTIFAAWVYTRRARIGNTTSAILLGILLLRTVAAGVWIYVPSYDYNDLHDVFMIIYVLNSVLSLCCLIKIAPTGRPGAKVPGRLLRLWGLNLIPMIYFMYSHKVNRVAGAYSIYGCFEWLLIPLDLGIEHAIGLFVKDVTLTLNLSSASDAKSGKQ